MVKLISKKWKNSSFPKKKSLVRLTPGRKMLVKLTQGHDVNYSPNAIRHQLIERE